MHRILYLYYGGMGSENSMQFIENPLPKDYRNSYQQPNIYVSIVDQTKLQKHTVVISSQAQLAYEQQMFIFRRCNSDHIVNARHFENLSVKEMCANTYQVVYYTDHPQNRIFDIPEINYEDAYSYIIDALKGFALLVHKVGYFIVTPKMIVFDADNKVKVWLSQNFAETRIQKEKKLRTQREFLLMTINIFQSKLPQNTIQSKVFWNLITKNLKRQEDLTISNALNILITLAPSYLTTARNFMQTWRQSVNVSPMERVKREESPKVFFFNRTSDTSANASSLTNSAKKQKSLKRKQKYSQQVVMRGCIPSKQTEQNYLRNPKMTSTLKKPPIQANRNRNGAEETFRQNFTQYRPTTTHQTLSIQNGLHLTGRKQMQKQSQTFLGWKESHNQSRKKFASQFKQTPAQKFNNVISRKSMDQIESLKKKNEVQKNFFKFSKHAYHKTVNLNTVAINPSYPQHLVVIQKSCDQTANNSYYSPICQQNAPISRPIQKISRSHYESIREKESNNQRSFLETPYQSKPSSIDKESSKKRTQSSLKDITNKISVGRQIQGKRQITELQGNKGNSKPCHKAHFASNDLASYYGADERSNGVFEVPTSTRVLKKNGVNSKTDIYAKIRQKPPLDQLHTIKSIVYSEGEQDYSEAVSLELLESIHYKK